jgi:hypothetical protein
VERALAGKVEGAAPAELCRGASLSSFHRFGWGFGDLVWDLVMLFFFSRDLCSISGGGGAAGARRWR